MEEFNLKVPNTFLSNLVAICISHLMNEQYEIYHASNTKILKKIEESIYNVPKYFSIDNSHSY